MIKLGLHLVKGQLEQNYGSKYPYACDYMHLTVERAAREVLSRYYPNMEVGLNVVIWGGGDCGMACVTLEDGSLVSDYDRELEKEILADVSDAWANVQKMTWQEVLRERGWGG